MLRDSNSRRHNPLFDELAQARPTNSDQSGGFDRLIGPATPFLDALIEAGPETAEHLLKAMQELLLAGKMVIEAAERGVEAQRDKEPARPEPRVRHIDID